MTILFPSRILTMLVFVASLSADIIPAAGYDITDAVLSGHGNWAHTYTGTITPGSSFVNYANPGVTALYSGVGSGTLNDNVIGSHVNNTQLFLAASPTDPSDLPINLSITFTFSYANIVNTIDIYGGDIIDNYVPGAISGVTVGLLDYNFNYHEAIFSTTPFGSVLNLGGVQVNDRISLVGSSLEGIPAYAITLHSFQGNVANWISITEVTFEGDQFDEDSSAIPEPSTAGLFGGGWLFCVWALRHRTLQCAARRAVYRSGSVAKRNG